MFRRVLGLTVFVCFFFSQILNGWLVFLRNIFIYNNPYLSLSAAAAAAAVCLCVNINI
jgi:hypothetical protein